MRSIVKCGCAAALVCAVLCLSGCERMFEDHTKQTLETADQKYAQGDFQGAVQYYEAAIDGTPATADVHYKLAQLYDEKLKNPLAAMHHYQRYLDLKPDGPHAKDAMADIKKDEREYASTLGNGAFMPQADAAKLENANIALQKQVNELRAAASHVPAQRDTGSQSSGSSHEDTLPAGGTTYMVMSGDTLASIARKFYKNSARWKDIEQANYSKLKGSAKLKPGMTLVIPK